MARMDWRARASTLYQGLVNGSISDTEQALSRIYQDAWAALSDKVNRHFAAFAGKDAEMQAALNKGLITKERYQQWRINYMGRGERFDKLRDTVATKLTQVNQAAAAYVNNDTVSMYALSHDFAAYTIEAQAADIAGVNFNLINERALREAVNGGNHVDFRVLSVDPVRDYKWNEGRITEALTSAILQGQSTKGCAASFLKVMENNEYAAIRNARTAMTSAQGAGCQQAAEEAEDMGLAMQKEWMAATDDRTRESHAELNGVRVPIGDPFPNGLMYPGDPAGAPAEVYNCRCTMITVVEGLGPGPSTANTVKSYQEWRASKAWQ